MKILRLLLISSVIFGVSSAVFPKMSEAQSSSSLHDRIFDYHHQKMIRQRGSGSKHRKSSPLWKDRKFKSGPNVTIAQIKQTAPILKWNISRNNVAFTSLRVIGEAHAGDEVRVSSVKQQGLRRVFFIRKGITGWVKEDNLKIIY